MSAMQDGGAAAKSKHTGGRWAISEESDETQAVCGLRVFDLCNWKQNHRTILDLELNKNMKRRTVTFEY
jgi:hypothetical protein